MSQAASEVGEGEGVHGQDDGPWSRGLGQYLHGLNQNGCPSRKRFSGGVVVAWTSPSRIGLWASAAHVRGCGSIMGPSRDIEMSHSKQS